MRRLFLQATAFYRQHVGVVVLAILGLLSMLLIQIIAESASAGWPQKWQFHSRIRFGRLNHGRPELCYYHPNGAWRHLPYLPGLSEQILDNDSISKEYATTRLFVMRDSASYRLRLQWAWNEKNRVFEYAGHTFSINQ